MSTVQERQRRKQRPRFRSLRKHKKPSAAVEHERAQVLSLTADPATRMFISQTTPVYLPSQTYALIDLANMNQHQMYSPSGGSGSPTLVRMSRGQQPSAHAVFAKYVPIGHHRMSSLRIRVFEALLFDRVKFNSVLSQFAPRYSDLLDFLLSLGPRVLRRLVQPQVQENSLRAALLQHLLRDFHTRRLGVDRAWTDAYTRSLHAMADATGDLPGDPSLAIAQQEDDLIKAYLQALHAYQLEQAELRARAVAAQANPRPRPSTNAFPAPVLPKTAFPLGSGAAGPGLYPSQLLYGVGGGGGLASPQSRTTAGKRWVPGQPLSDSTIDTSSAVREPPTVVTSEARSESVTGAEAGTGAAAVQGVPPSPVTPVGHIPTAAPAVTRGDTPVVVQCVQAVQPVPVRNSAPGIAPEAGITGRKLRAKRRQRKVRPKLTLPPFKQDRSEQPARESRAASPVVSTGWAGRDEMAGSAQHEDMLRVVALSPSNTPPRRKYPVVVSVGATASPHNMSATLDGWNLDSDANDSMSASGSPMFLRATTGAAHHTDSPHEPNVAAAGPGEQQGQQPRDVRDVVSEETPVSADTAETPKVATQQEPSNEAPQPAAGKLFAAPESSPGSSSDRELAATSPSDDTARVAPPEAAEATATGTAVASGDAIDGHSELTETALLVLFTAVLERRIMINLLTEKCELGSGDVCAARRQAESVMSRLDPHHVHKFFAVPYCETMQQCLQQLVQRHRDGGTRGRPTRCATYRMPMPGSHALHVLETTPVATPAQAVGVVPALRLDQSPPSPARDDRGGASTDRSRSAQPAAPTGRAVSRVRRRGEDPRVSRHNRSASAMSARPTKPRARGGSLLPLHASAQDAEAALSGDTAGVASTRISLLYQQQMARRGHNTPAHTRRPSLAAATAPSNGAPVKGGRPTKAAEARPAGRAVSGPHPPVSPLRPSAGWHSSHAAPNRPGRVLVKAKGRRPRRRGGGGQTMAPFGSLVGAQGYPVAPASARSAMAVSAAARRAWSSQDLEVSVVQPACVRVRCGGGGGG